MVIDVFSSLGPSLLPSKNFFSTCVLSLNSLGKKNKGVWTKLNYIYLKVFLNIVISPVTDYWLRSGKWCPN